VVLLTIMEFYLALILDFYTYILTIVLNLNWKMGMGIT